ncbi:hypothetical protein GCM10027035_17830 [Emticicia sediminis]
MKVYLLVFVFFVLGCSKNNNFPNTEEAELCYWDCTPVFFITKGNNQESLTFDSKSKKLFDNCVKKAKIQPTQSKRFNVKINFAYTSKDTETNCCAVGILQLRVITLNKLEFID